MDFSNFAIFNPTYYRVWIMKSATQISSAGTGIGVLLGVMVFCSELGNLTNWQYILHEESPQITIAGKGTHRAQGGALYGFLGTQTWQKSSRKLNPSIENFTSSPLEDWHEFHLAGVREEICISLANNGLVVSRSVESTLWFMRQSKTCPILMTSVTWPLKLQPFSRS